MTDKKNGIFTVPLIAHLNGLFKRKTFSSWPSRRIVEWRIEISDWRAGTAPWKKREAVNPPWADRILPLKVRNLRLELEQKSTFFKGLW